MKRIAFLIIVFLCTFAQGAGADNTTSVFQPVDPSNYPDNMSMVIRLTDGGIDVDGAEVAAFIDGECRGSIKVVGGHYFLTVLGISANDTHKPIVLKAWYDDKEYDIADTGYYFASDASYGSFSEGLVNLTIVSSLVGDANDDGQVTISDAVAVVMMCENNN